MRTSQIRTWIALDFLFFFVVWMFFPWKWLSSTTDFNFCSTEICINAEESHPCIINMIICSHLNMKLLVTLTKAPMTPRLVRRRYSNGRVLLTVWRNGYRKRGILTETRKKDIYIFIFITSWHILHLQVGVRSQTWHTIEPHLRPIIRGHQNYLRYITLH